MVHRFKIGNELQFLPLAQLAPYCLLRCKDFAKLSLPKYDFRIHFKFCFVFFFIVMKYVQCKVNPEQKT